MDKGGNLLDFISPDLDAAKNINVSSVDEAYLTIDAGFNMRGVKIGKTKIHITSGYDGFDKDVVMKIANTTAAIAMQKYGVTGIPMLNDVLKVLNIKIEGVNDKEETESKPVQSDAQNANDSALPKQEGEEAKSE